MTFDYLKHLKSTDQTIKLLSSDNFAFMLSFFYLVFVKKQHLTLPYSQILLYLDDYLFELNSLYENILPRSAKEYLDDFSSDKHSYLRKYHGDGDEPLFELTPHANKALEFVESLQKNEFVASRSKFNIIFDLLEDLEFETGMDDASRVAKLQAQKRVIDAQIEAIEQKRDLRFDTARIKEHYMQIEEIARKLKYDFSEMEYNFRHLNRLAMEQIALKDDAKSGVLESIFEVEDSIRDSDQGKSFFAFWQLLTDVQKSEKFTLLLKNLYEIDAVKSLGRDEQLKDIKFTLLQSGEKIHTVSAKLIEQLRRFIDDRAWVENRRVLELSKEIEKSAIEIKENIPTKREFFSMKGYRVKIDSVFEKRLYTPKVAQNFTKELKTQEITLDMESFYNIFFVDEEILKRNIAQMLEHSPQCTLLDVVEKFPITKGVSELVSYISIAKNSNDTRIETSALVRIKIVDSDGKEKYIKLPKIIFIKAKK